MDDIKVTRGPFRALGHFEFLSDYGQQLEVKHISGHDFLEVWIDERYTVFKRTDKEAAKKLAAYLLEWASDES